LGALGNISSELLRTFGARSPVLSRRAFSSDQKMKPVTFSFPGD
jgi:hypothetical protein